MATAAQIGQIVDDVLNRFEAEQFLMAEAKMVINLISSKLDLEAAKSGNDPWSPDAQTEKVSSEE